MDHLIRLKGLHPFEYEHPFDSRALDALQRTPGLDLIVRKFSKHALERIVTVQCTGSNLKITEGNYPQIYYLLDKACEILNLPLRPDLYIEWSYAINGGTMGVDKPIIILTSGAIDLLDDLELLYLIGHEVGHIKSRHFLYHQMADFLPYITNTVGQVTLGIGKLLTTPIVYALLHWYRMSEFTADRAGLLACQDISATGRVMMKSAGLPLKFYGQMDHKAFLDQAKEFHRLDYDKLNKAVKFLSIIDSSHPWTVMRTAELLHWMETGEYNSVLKRETTKSVHERNEGNSLFCRNCDFRLEGTEKFCPCCGNRLRAGTGT